MIKHKCFMLISTLLMGTILCDLFAEDGQLEVFSVPLRPVKFDGVSQVKNGLALRDDAIVQKDPNMIVIEAEDADSFTWQKYIGVLKAGRSAKEGDLIQEYAGEKREYTPQDDDTASGGKYIDYTASAVYNFTITNPGKYTCWIRHYLPWKGYWCYHHLLDSKQGARVNMPSKKYVVKKWFWKKGNEWDFTKGTHSYAIKDLMGGKRLDKIIFVKNPDYKPEGSGPKATPKMKLDSGEVVFSELQPAGLKQWLNLRRKVDFYGGSIRFSVSADNGKNWQQLPPDNKLSKKLITEKALTFKASFKRAEGRPSPKLKEIAANFLVDTNNFVVIENDFYRLSFDKKTGLVCRIQNLRTGADVIDPGLPNGKLDIFIKGKKQAGKWLSFSEAEILDVDTDSNSIQTQYAFLDEKIKVTTNVSVAEGIASKWQITIENNSDIDVTQVKFPQISKINLDANSKDDILLWPDLGGKFYPVPAQGTNHEGFYPDHCGIGMVDIFDETGGFCIATVDDYVVSTHIVVKPELDRDCITMNWEKRHRIKAKGGKQTYNYLMGVHPNNWKDAADLYRNSFHKRFGHSDYPDWLVETDGWIVGHAGIDSGHNKRRYNSIRKGWLNALEFGHNYVQVWGSTFAGACPVYYLPRKECGGEEDFKRWNKEFRDAGGKIGYYFHGNSIGGAYLLIDKYFMTPWSEYPKEVRPPSWEWYVENRQYPKDGFKVTKEVFEKRIKDWKEKKGSNQSSGLNSYENMSFIKDGFRKWLAWWTDKYIKDYHCNTQYYDTMAWGGRYQEYNPYGDFNGEGDAPMYKKKFLADNITRLRPHEPDYAQLTEGTVDIYNIHCYSLLSGFTKHGNVDVIRYMFPEMIFFDGNANGRWGKDSHRDSLAGSFLMGNKLDCIVLSHYSEKLFALRQLISPLLARSKYLAKAGIDTSNTAVKARGHLLESGKNKLMVITMQNPNPKEFKDATATIDLKEYCQPAYYYLFQLGEAPQKITPEVNGSKICFKIPNTYSSALVGIEKVASKQAVAASNRYDGVNVVCRLMNYSDKAIKINVKVASKDIRFKTDTIEKEFAPGFHELKFKPENANELNTRRACTVDISWSGGKRRYATWCGPIWDDGEFEFYFDPGVVKGQGYKGNTCHLIGKADKAYPREFTDDESTVQNVGVYSGKFWTLPQYRYRVSFAQKGKVPNAYFHNSWKSERPGQVRFKKVKEDKGWNIYQAEFDGFGGPGRLYFRPNKKGHSLIDSIKVEVIGNKK